MTETKIQHEHVVITNTETVKMMSDPLRMRIAEALTEPHTTKDLAQVFDVPVTRLYYHIGLMEEHGMIQVVDTQMVSGIQEKRYQLIARNFSIDGDIFRFDSSAKRSIDEMVAALFDNARRQLRILVANRSVDEKISEDGTGSEDGVAISLQQSLIALTPDERDELDAELESILHRYSPDRADLPPDADLFSLTYALFPNVEAEALNTD